MACDLSIPLHRVHIAHIDTGTGDLDWCYDYRACPDRIDIHMTIGPRLEFFGLECELMWRADESRGEVACIVRVWHRDRRECTELAEEEIGRASCREKVEVEGGVGRRWKRIEVRVEMTTF